MPFNRAHFEATGVDSAVLDKFAALSIDWTKLAALIQAVLAFLGVSFPVANASLDQMKTAALGAGIDWQKLLSGILQILPILLGTLGKTGA